MAEPAGLDAQSLRDEAAALKRAYLYLVEQPGNEQDYQAWSGWQKSIVLIERLVGCVAEAERRKMDAIQRRSEELDELVAVKLERDELRAALADAREALEAVVLMEQSSDQGWREVYKSAQNVAREVLGRLDKKEKE